MIFYVKKAGADTNTAQKIFADSPAEAVRAFVKGLDLYPAADGILRVDCFEGVRNTGGYAEWKDGKKTMVPTIFEIGLKEFFVLCALPERIEAL